MLKILHVSTECYPAAKAGGMGDVVGALPIYSRKEGMEASVIIPKYKLSWFEGKAFKEVYSGSYVAGYQSIHFRILKLEEGVLSYPFYCVDMPGLFDRPSVYLDVDGEGFSDEAARNFGFQRATLLWLNQLENQFDLIHCHDHQAGLIPFFMSHGPSFSALKKIPSYFTIHNGAYHGRWHWENQVFLPPFYHQDRGMLDWDGTIHSLSAALKSSWGFNTVSPNYLNEIAVSSGSLNWLFHNEKAKSKGILNGIDNELWDPKTDELLDIPLKKSWDTFKKKNKEALLNQSALSPKRPLFGFIGRFATQKGADILCWAIRTILHQTRDANFVILGTGAKDLEQEVWNLSQEFPENVLPYITYNEALAHKIYASCDFLLMPSRFEPCGLNQMFAMRYGTLPIVHATGGLVDTVTDIEEGGTGIQFNTPEVLPLVKAIQRGVDLHKDEKQLKAIRQKATEQDFSWTRSVLEYKEAYLKLLNTL